ncbi:MAG: tyrosine-type recombinase/integrase [Candidatus Nanoarchaeia archaeon]
MINQEDWVQWLQAKKLSEKSIHDYCVYFRKLDFDSINEKYLEKWINKFNNGVARAMLNNLLIYIRTHQEIPREIKELALNFEIPKITGRKKQRIPKVLTREQVHQLARAMPHKRERYMVLSTFYLGLRSEELLNLSVDCFDWEKSQVRIIGKGNKERVLPLVPNLKERLILYINENIEKNPEFSILFPISARYWRKILDKVSRKKLGRPVNPHLLRHSCGSYLHEHGLDLKEIAEYLGHSDISTTQLYVHLNKRNLNARVQNAFTN